METLLDDGVTSPTLLKQELSVNNPTLSPAFTPLIRTVAVAIKSGFRDGLVRVTPVGAKGASFIVTERLLVLLSYCPSVRRSWTLN